MEVGELLALRQQGFALVGDQPPVQVGGAVVAVQGGPLLLHTGDGPEQLGSAEPREPALGNAEAVLPVEELLDVLLADTMADRHRHQRIRLPCTAAENLLGAGAVEELLADGQSLLTGGAVEPRHHMRNGVEAVDHHPLLLHRRRWVDLCAKETRVLRRLPVQVLLPFLIRLFGTRADVLPDDDGGRRVGGVLGAHQLAGISRFSTSLR